MEPIALADEKTIIGLNALSRAGVFKPSNNSTVLYSTVYVTDFLLLRLLCSVGLFEVQAQIQSVLILHLSVGSDFAKRNENSSEARVDVKIL